MDQVNHSYRSLRRVIGILGIGLPFLLIIGNLAKVEMSISYYYYTKMNTVFTGVLIAFGLILITYRGSSSTKGLFSENMLTNLAGVCALLVALVPTRSEGLIETVVYAHDQVLRGWIHYVSAALFILLMGMVVLIHFAKAPHFQSLYKALGILVLSGLAFVVFAFVYREKQGTELFTGPYFLGRIVFVVGIRDRVAQTWCS